MPYTKTSWKDRVVEKPLTFNLQNNADGTVTLIPAEGTIVDPGIPITATALNNLEKQYDEALTWVKSFGLGDVATLISNTDLNTLDATGIYRGSPLTNAPSTGGYYIINFKAVSDVKTQMAIAYSGGSVIEPLVYLRSQVGASWGSWIQLAKANQESWTTLTLQNSWVSFGGAYSTPAYRKNNNGEVELRGIVKDGVATTGTTFATLPSGYRPNADKSYPIVTRINSVDTLGRIVIYTTGEIKIQSGGNQFLSLDGIPPIPTN